MNNDNTNWLHELLHLDVIPVEDIPDIELYMDQVTTFMDTRLNRSKRYPDDKIMTKTMINNYTKNHLLPPSIKKKYAKEHIFLLIMIYYLKNMLSISDIQSLLAPLSENYFPENKKNALSLKEIYEKMTNRTQNSQEEIEDSIDKVWETTRDSFSSHTHSEEESEYLDDFAFIYQLCYEIYVRKQMIERLIDLRRERAEKKDAKTQKAIKKTKKDLH